MGVAHADAQALAAGVVILELLLELLLGQQKLPHLLDVQLPVFGGAHRIARAVKELGAQLLFQLRDEGGQGWLCDIEALGGAGDVLLLRQNQKIVQLIQGHKGCPLFYNFPILHLIIGSFSPLCKLFFVNDSIGNFQFYKRKKRGYFYNRRKNNNLSKEDFRWSSPM